MLVELLSLNAWSSSNKDSEPVDASNCPTGNAEFPRSERIFLTLYSITLSDISTTSLGDISIKSKVDSNLFILSTATLMPRIFWNSLYTTFPFTPSLKYAGFVSSFTKVVLLFISSFPSVHPYAGVKVSYSFVTPFQILNCPTSSLFSITRYAYPLTDWSGNKVADEIVSAKTNESLNLSGIFVNPYCNSTYPSFLTIWLPSSRKSFSLNTYASVQLSPFKYWILHLVGVVLLLSP